MSIRVMAMAALILGAMLTAANGGEEGSATLERITTPTLRISRLACGALLRDDFDSNRWGPQWEEPWIQDTALKVHCKDGRLRISGVSGRPVPVCADHHEFRFVGLVSHKFTQRDVVLACTMQVLAPLPKGETRVRYLSHLCGAVPDYFVDFGVSHEPDGREGWLFVPIADGYPISHDHKSEFYSLEETPPDREQTLVIRHFATTKVTQGFIVDGDLWRPMGEHTLFLATTQAELKVDVPYNGVRVDVAYDDVRMYPRPEVAPARFVLLKPPFPFFPFPSANIALEDAEGKTIARGQTNTDGESVIPLPADRLYPIGGKIIVSVGAEVLGEARITARGVDGLYPGDVWTIIAPDKFKVTDRGYPMGM